jgi:predicted dehydrogenase
MRVCLTGFGYWGPNLARNIAASKYFELKYILEPDQSKHGTIKSLYPFVQILIDSSELEALRDSIDVGVIATPTATHADLAIQFLNLGCHVWIEKPFALSSRDATVILKVAAERKKKVFVDHTFLYTSAVSRIKEEIESISPLTYVNSTRANFGIIQQDSSVIWDLAVHDLAILGHLIDLNPLSVIAKASTPFPNIQKSSATVLLDYGQFLATIHVNWLSPFKIRDFFVGGIRGSVRYDDTETEDKVRIYSQSIESLFNYDKSSIRQFDYKYGNVKIPDIENNEALATAFEAFGKYILFDIEPPSSGEKALKIIKILEAADHSLNNNGMLVSL